MYQRIILKQEHDKLSQASQILLVLLILDLALIIDISQVRRSVKIRLILGRISIILRRHKTALHKRAPGVEAQQGHGTLAEPVGGSALSKLRDAIVLAAKGDEAADRRVVAALNVAAQELAALGEADCVYAGSGGEDGMRGEDVADGGYLGRDVAEKGARAVGAGVVAGDGDAVDKGAWVDCLSRLTDPLDAFAVKGVA